MNKRIEEVENLTISDIRKALRNIISVTQDVIGECSLETNAYLKMLENFELIVNEFYSDYAEYSVSSFVLKDLSFRHYLGID